jgi:sensor histidine kinase YesM
MEFNSLADPSTWLLLFVAWACMNMGVLVMNAVLVGRLPSFWHFVTVALVMFVGCIPTVIIASPFVAQMQLLLAVVAFFIYARNCLPGRPSSQLFWSATMMLSGVVIILVVSAVFLWIASVSTISPYILEFFSSLISVGLLALWVALIVKKKLFRYQESKADIFWALVACLCALALAVLIDAPLTEFIVFLDATIKAGYERDILFVVIFFVILLVANYIYHNQNNHLHTIKFEANYSQLISSYLLSLDATTMTLRGLRHDLRNHLIVLSALAQKGDVAALQEYVQHIQEVMSEADVFPATGNNVIDIVLNAKRLVAQEKGIRISLRASLPSTIFLKDFEAVTLVGNLLDNAIEAVTRVLDDQATRGALEEEPAEQNDDNAHIHVVIKKQRDNLLFLVENIALAPAKRFGSYVSHKAQQEGHGLGLTQVRRLVGEHDGYLDIVFTPLDSQGSIMPDNPGVSIMRKSFPKASEFKIPGVSISKSAVPYGTFRVVILLPIPNA